MASFDNSGSRISKLVSGIEPSPTLAVDAKGKALKAKGEPVVSFGAGEPDFPTPDAIVEAAIEAAKNPKYHKYSPVAGLEELRNAIAQKTSITAGADYNVSQTIVTNGGKHALYNACLTLLDPEDEVLLPAPVGLLGDVMMINLVFEVKCFCNSSTVT